MHWIARHILKRLAFADSQTYTQLLPDSVSGNLFQYHAKALEASGLIKRSAQGYALTPAGSRTVADMSATKLMRPQHQPQPMVAAYVKNHSTRQLLLFEWKRHPYRNLISLPMGRHLYGMTALQATNDQLYWKAGIGGTYTYHGIVEIMIEHDNQLIRHTLLSVGEYSDVYVMTSPDGLTGTAFWANPVTIDRDRWVPGALEIVECMTTKRSFPRLISVLG